MSSFAVRVHKIVIEPHPDADRLELAKVGKFRSVVAKGQFKTGDLAAYLPEASLVPEALLVEMGLVGKLAGSAHNRIKAIRLRGVVSQGICYPTRAAWQEGQDVAEELGIIKWEPPIPTGMGGEVYLAGHRYLSHYDIENWKAWPDVLQEGEDVVFTEKIHGTFCMCAVLRDGTRIVASKGLGGKGFAFVDDASNAHNLYLRAVTQHDVASRVQKFLLAYLPVAVEAVTVFGEVFGAGVQDLTYGHDVRKNAIGFRVFDVKVTQTGEDARFLGHFALEAFCAETGLARVPLVYIGPYSTAALKTHTSGKTLLGGAHMREGLVVRPVHERQHDELPSRRVQLKSVSDAYLFRSGEQTEFQ